jgi:hypothetical protein
VFYRIRVTSESAPCNFRFDVRLLFMVIIGKEVVTCCMAPSTKDWPSKQPVFNTASISGYLSMELKQLVITRLNFVFMKLYLTSRGIIVALLS